MSYVLGIDLNPNNKTQVLNKNKLKVISSLKEYKEVIAKNENYKLLEIKKFIPNIHLDLRYATTNNFTKKKLYKYSRAFLAKQALDSLIKIQKELNKKGLGILIYDAYRPYSVTVKLYKTYKNPVFVAPPSKGSRHNRGCALDISLIDMHTKKELEMPTTFDAFVKEARPTVELKNKTAQHNRTILIEIMKKYGFKVSLSEWWHFDFIGYKKFPIFNLDFEVL